MIVDKEMNQNPFVAPFPHRTRVLPAVGLNRTFSLTAQLRFYLNSNCPAYMATAGVKRVCHCLMCCFTGVWHGELI